MIWDQLSETGKTHFDVPIFSHLEAITAELYEEAKEEGVRLSIKVVPSGTGGFRFYVSLRRNKGV